MAKLKFNSAGIASARKHATSAKNTSTSVKDGVASIQKNMQSCVTGRSNISSRLTNVRSNLTQIETGITTIYQMVDNTSIQYINTETSVVKLGQAVVQSAKITTTNGNNKGAFASIKHGKNNKASSLTKNFNNKSKLSFMQEAAKIKWGSKNNITQKCNPTSKYFDIPLDRKYTPKKYELSKGVLDLKGFIDPILHPSPYEGRFKNINPKLTPSSSDVQGVKAEVTATTKEEFDLKLADLASGIFGSAGTTGKSVGGIISSVSDIYNGYKDGNTTDTWKGILGIGDTMVSTIGELAENAFKVDSDWKEVLIGNWKKGSALTEIAEKTAKYSDDAVVTGLLKSELDGFIPSTAKNVGENLKVGAQWFGVAISAVTNGMDNYDDYQDGKMSANRAIVETVSETAVDVVIGAGSVALVGAGVTALGLSAPAVAVGAVAAGAVWLVDLGVRAGTKALTEAGYMEEEKGLTELISDTILDVAEKKIEHEVNKIKNIGNAICNVGNFIGTKWGECFG